MAVDRPRLMPPRRSWIGIASICVAWLALSPVWTVESAHAQPPAREKDAAPSSDAATEEDEVKADSGLPKGYVPPRDPPDEMLLEKNLLTPEEREQGKRELSKNYSTRIRNADIRSQEAKEGIRNGIRYRLNELTIAKNRRDLTKIRERLTLQDLRQAGTTAGLKPEQLRDFRRQLLTMIVEETEKLFDNNYYVRLQAALILGELNLMEEDAPKGIAREAFAGAALPLTRVIQDPQQPEAVKIVSVLSLIRIMRHGNPNVEQKRDVATAAVSELKRNPKESHYWYQMRLAELLGAIDVSLDLNREPFVFNVLNSVLNDPARDLSVRIQAAWSLGRHPLAPQVDVSRLSADIAAVGLELAKQHAANPGAAHWRRCAVMLYLTFQAKDKTDLDAERKRPGGLLNYPVAAGPAKEAYAQLLPVITAIINGERVAPEQIQSIQKWLQERSPKPNGQQVGGLPGPG